MFLTVASLEADLRHFVTNRSGVVLPFRFANGEVGKGLIQLAGGKIPEALAHLAEGDSGPRIDAQKAAIRFVSEVMLGSTSDHFTTLGLSPDTDGSLLRDNFRRLMALVHPDAQPEGFPSDAASRVNRAYAVLADPEARAAYIAQQSVIAPAVFPTVQASPQWTVERPKERPGNGVGNRLRNLANALRARHVLLWLAVLLLIPLGVGLTSMFTHEAPARLVEARPKLNFSVDLGNVATTGPAANAAAPRATSDANIVPDAANDSTSKTAHGIGSSAQVGPSARRRSDDAAGAAQPATAMSGQLSLKSSDLALRGSTKLSLAPVAPQTNVNVPSAGVVPAPGPAPESIATTVRVADPAPAIPVAAQAGTVAVSQRPAAADRADVPPRMKTTDAEEVLVKFTNAYESGSIGVFGQLFASGMAGRRQMLSDYERVFLATRQRSIKFNQLKHSNAGERVATSGYATVTTTDQDNRTVTQRVFLEFEIGRERGEPRIERLANYVIN